jgi:sodium-dependent phosphate cotransporter
MPVPNSSRLADVRRRRSSIGTLPRLIALVLLLYAFLVSIGLLGKAFKLLGGSFVDGIIEGASNPLIGLFVGILATTLVQSSSTTTSLIVALVGGGSIPVSSAIPMVMGANIGTSVTNTLVSLGHVMRGREYYRAIAASTIHDFFNVLAVLLLFPLQITTNFLGRLSEGLAGAFDKLGGLTFTSPLKILTEPAVRLAVSILSERAWLLLLLALVILFASLRYLVLTLKGLVMTRLESAFDDVIFRNAARAMGLGLLLTVLVQSSSITTSLVVPLAAAGLLSLRQIYPYTLGANVGTTVTATLAALAVGELSALTVAFAHFLFNVFGIAVIWPVVRVREIPMRLARRLAHMSVRNRWVPLVYIVLGFYLLPLALILWSR